MSVMTPKRLTLLASCLLVPGVLFFAWWGWTGMDGNLKAEKFRIRHFEESAASRVTKGLGDEIFHLENFFSLGLARASREPGFLRPADTEPVLAAYRSLAHYPDLVQELFWVSGPASGPHRWSRWTPSGWVPAEIPDWFQGTQAVITRNPDPTLSLDSPWFTYPVPAPPGSLAALVVHYSLKTVLEKVVPELTGKAFGSGDRQPQFEVSMVRRVLAEPAGVLRADLTVPLVGQMKFSTWLRDYLAGFDDPVQESLAPGPQWALDVKYLPNGLEDHLREIQYRNWLWAGGVTAFLGGGGCLFLFSILMKLRATRRERTFAALVCHELKTPLAAIRALAENLAEGIVADGAKVRDYGTRIQEQSVRLEEMVGNLMSLSRGGPKPGVQVPGPVDLGELARAAAARAGVALEGDIPGPWVALGASAAIRAALDNLVTNAFKYGVRPGCAPEITLGLHKRTRWGVRWTGVSVTDHGESRSVRRLRSRGSGRQPGGGIGLDLVRDTQRHLRGRIEVRPVPGGGLCFTLWLREGPQQ